MTAYALSLMTCPCQVGVRPTQVKRSEAVEKDKPMMIKWNSLDSGSWMRFTAYTSKSRMVIGMINSPGHMDFDFDSYGAIESKTLTLITLVRKVKNGLSI